MRYTTKITAVMSLAMSLTLIFACSSQDKPMPLPDNANIGESTQSLDQEASLNPTYHFLAGEVAIDRGVYTEALREYLWLAEHMNDPVFAARATSIALELHDFNAAAKTAKIWADKVPHDLQTQAIAASLLLKTGCIDCAKPYLASLLVPSDTETMQHLVQVESALEDVASRKHLIQALAQLGQEKKDFRVLFIEADLQYQLGEITNANKTIDTILAIKPNWIRAQSLRIQILYESGQKQEAYTYLNNMLAKDPQNPALKWLSAKMSIEMGQTDKGIALLKTITGDTTYGNDALLELTKQLIEQNKLSEAQRYLTTFQAKQPDSDEGKFLMGFVQQEQGQLDNAFHTYNTVKGGLYYLNARIQMALIMTRKGNAPQALEEVDRLAKQFPDDLPRIALVRAQVLLDSNQYQPAYDALTQIIRNTPDNVELHYIRGLVAVELDRNEAAMDDFKFVLSHNPKHLQAINALAQTLINEGKLNEAQPYTEQAMNLAPTHPDVLDNIGWLLYKRGHVEEAIPYLARAYKTGQNAEYAAHLGEALWANGEQDEAIVVWKAGLELDPNNAVVRNAMKMHAVQPTSTAAAMDNHP